MSSRKRDSLDGKVGQIRGLLRRLRPKFSNQETNDPTNQRKKKSSDSGLLGGPSTSDSVDILVEPTQALRGESLLGESAELQARQLISKAASALARFKGLGDVKDIDEAIECQSQVLSLTPVGHVERAQRMDELGVSLRLRFQRVGKLSDVNKAIDYQTQVVQLTPDGHAHKPVWLNNLGNSYGSRFSYLGELVDVDRAIDYQSQAVQLTPDGHASKPMWLNNLGISHGSRFRRLGEFDDLGKEIDYVTQAVQLTTDGQAHKPIWLNNLGASYHTRFRRLGDLADLNKAIDYKAQAVLLTPDGYANKPSWLTSVGNSYLSRFERLGELADLDKAVEYMTQAVQLTPDGHADWPRRVNNLGNSYQSRFRRLGQLPDVDTAISYQTQALQLTPDGHVDKPSWLNNLGNSYESRFRRLGKLVDVDKAIDYQAQAVQLTPDGHVDKPNLLTNLGNSYESRFRHLGELADVDKAIDSQTQAVCLTLEGHPEKPYRLTNLGISYESRFERLGELKDLDNAIGHLTQAVQLTPDGDADKPSWLNNLGNSYLFRFSRFGELADGDKAIICHTQAVELTPDGHADKPSWLKNLGTSHCCRFRRLGQLVDVEKAIVYQTQALRLTPDGHAELPDLLYSLGMSYKSRFEHLNDVSDLESAQSSFQRAAQLAVTRPQGQIKCARNWAKSLSQLDQSPQLAYERCMELVPRLIWLGTTVKHRYSRLHEVADLATEAAAWAISVQQYDLALEWLEEGRTIVWNQILQLRTPFDELSSVDPELAQQLKNTASELQGFGLRQEEAPSLKGQPVLDRGTYHHRLASEWEHLVENARRIPGFHHFLRPRKASALKLAATNGPIVIINAHSTRCDALVIFPDSTNIAHIPLKRFSPTKAAQYRELIGSMAGQRGDQARGFKKSNPQPRPEDGFKPILTSLWLDLVKPILDTLGYTRQTLADNMPHITWCTTGALTFLPLHAAGFYDGLQPNTFDLVISSYTPTLSALLTPSAPITSLDTGVLAVGQANTRGFSPLPYTVQELAAIKTCAKGVRFQQLDGANGTVEAVLDALDKHSWVHLACHATQDPVHPTHSAFHLHNGDLTLEAITRHSFTNKGLAFLSACQTATGDDELPDEAIHLAAGVLMAGYPSVIATMWSIYDEDAPDIAGEVYAELLKDGKMDHRGAVKALHKAVSSLRGKVGVNEFTRWVPFIHIGA